MEDAAEDEDGANSDITPRERSTSQLGWSGTVPYGRLGWEGGASVTSHDPLHRGFIPGVARSGEPDTVPRVPRVYSSRLV